MAQRKERGSGPLLRSTATPRRYVQNKIQKQLLCLETEKAKQRRLDEKADEAYDELIEDMDPEDIEYMQQMNNKSK